MVWQGLAWRGQARYGWAGMARRGMARRGQARHGEVWQARRGAAWRGAVGTGQGWPGPAWKGRRDTAEQFIVEGEHMQNRVKDMSVIVELKRIATAGKGILQPSAVVEAAKPNTSPLHSHFTWDDSEAAAAWRLWQARQLISVCVEFVGPKDAEQEARVFVSLRDERGEEGGYRALISVLSEPDLRAQLLQDALAELKYFKGKYQSLKELSAVFEAIDSAQQLELVKQ